MNWHTLLLLLLTSGSRAFTQTSLTKYSNTATTSNTLKKICISHYPASRYLTILSATLDPTTVKKSGAMSSLISNLAVIALKLRLAKHSGVTCEVSASSSNIIFNGTIGPVSVKGRGWGSPLGLTCRAIEANVDKCTLDMNSVVKNRKLLLVEPAIGKAMIALDTTDFGSFITHPLFEAQAPSLSGRGNDGLFEFLKESTEITSNPNDIDAEGVVVFYGNCLGKRWRCELRRGSGNTVPSNRALVKVTPASSKSTSSRVLQEESRELSALITNFFNALVFELDGVYFSFKDLIIHTSTERRKTNDRSAHAHKSHVLIALAIKVKKFPSTGTAF